MKITAEILSVILTDSDSAHCHVSIGSACCNLTLRFDRGDQAMLCGYPMDWGVHDVNVGYYGHDSLVSRDVESDILKKLRDSVLAQFANPYWERDIDKERKEAILNKLNKAITNLDEGEVS